MKIKEVQLGDTFALKPSWRHWCPGCKMNHVIHTDPGAQSNGHHWTFDGNMDAPTFHPSVNIPGMCHYWIKAGQIQFCSDCTHSLAGSTVDMMELESVNESDWD